MTRAHFTFGLSVIAVAHVAHAQVARSYSGDEIPKLPGGHSSYATSINSIGQVVGASGTINGKDHAFLFSANRVSDLGALDSAAQAPFIESIANGINASGVIVGQSDGSTAVVIQNGVMSALPRFYTDGVAESVANAINAAGHIVGSATSATPRQFVGGQTKGALHAFLYRDSVLTDLGTIGGVAGASAAYAINDRDQIVGQSDTFGGFGFDHAFLYENGTMRDLGTLAGYEESLATSINASGTVVGFATITRNLLGGRRAFIYANGTMRDLGVLSTGKTASALGINGSGTVVGTADNAAGLPVAFVYSEARGMLDINSLPLALGVSSLGVLQRFIAAVAINNSGQIICQAQFSTGTVSTFLLSPDVAPPSIASQPIGQTVAIGQPVTLSVSATGEALTYQWSKNGTAIAGATGATFTVSAASASDAGSYTVTVRNAASSVTSQAAILTIASAVVPSRLVNLSIRSTAGSGDNTLIVGIVIGGAGTSGTKPILMRGIGPTLGDFGVNGFLVDPTLALFSGTTRVAEVVGPERINARFLDFSRHYGFEAKRCRPYRPRTKGKVERTVGYVRTSFLNGRTFAGLDDLNGQGRHWLGTVANVRLHGTTQARPCDRLLEETLIPVTDINLYQICRTDDHDRTVGAEALVRFDNSVYSVPARLVGTRVSIDAGASFIIIRAKHLIVAEHPRATAAGQRIEAPAHVKERWERSLRPPVAPPLQGCHVAFSDAVQVRSLDLYAEAAR